MKPPENFDYHYFDDPDALGYQGYHEMPGDGNVLYPNDEIIFYCQEHSITSALDIGCAKGFLVKSMIDHNIDAIGYDVSNYALSFAKGLPCYNHNVVDPIPCKAQVVIALGVLMYLPENMLSQSLSNIYNACERYFLFSSHYEGTPQKIPDPLRLITKKKEWWREKIESVGFKFHEEKWYFDCYEK